MVLDELFVVYGESDVGRVVTGNEALLIEIVVTIEDELAAVILEPIVVVALIDVTVVEAKEG